MDPKHGMILKIVAAVLFVTLFSMTIAFGVLWGETKKTVAERDKQIADLWNNTTTTPSPNNGGSTTLQPPVAADAAFLRLPRHIQPINYKVDLRVYLPFDQSEESMPNAFTTSGTVSIKLMPVIEGTKNITLHARTSAPDNSGKIMFDQGKVRLMKGSENVPNIKVDFQHSTVDVFVVETPDVLVMGQEYTLVVENFKGTIADDNQGLYRSYFERAGVKRYLATTQFQAYKARRVFPCFDEPGFRSTFDITLHHDARFTNTRSNGERQAKQNIENFNGKAWVTQPFDTTPNMSVYLVAFLISDFGSRSDNVTDRPNRIFAIEDMLEKGYRFPLKQSADSLTWMDDNLGQSYYTNAKKLDQAGVPDFTAGAMENWGMVLYREATLLYDPLVSSAEVKRASAAVIGHELAHMIFGNLVTCKWWDDTWLNEGFARFFQYEIMNGAPDSSKWGLGPLFSYWVVREAMQSDAYDSAHPLYDPSVTMVSAIDSMFDTVTYNKGASILQMIKGVMGRNAFYQAIKNYVVEYKFKNVVHQDLFRHLSAVDVSGGGKVAFDTYLKTWIEENGYPVIKLTRTGLPDGSNGSVIQYEQKRFLMRSGKDAAREESDRSDRNWYIPLTLVSGQEPSIGGGDPGTYSVCWIGGNQGEISDVTCPGLKFPSRPSNIDKPTNFIVANLNQAGFYRVNYDVENWRRISNYLRNYVTMTKIDEVSRGQLIDDAFNLARAGNYNVSYETVFNLVEYLKLEITYGPSASAMDNFRYLDQMLRSSTAAGEYQSLADYMKKLFDVKYPATNGLWDDSTWEEGEDETEYKTLLYNNAIIENSCFYENSPCLEDTKRHFEAWRDSKTSLGSPYIPTNAAGAVANFPQTRNIILCYGIRGSSQNADWDYLNVMHDNETSTSAKSSILRALACTDKSDLLQRLLGKTIDGSVRDQDKASVFTYISRWEEGANLAWTFITNLDNWNKLSRSRRHIIIADVTAAFNTDGRLKELIDFKDKVKIEPSAFDTAIAKVRANIAWTAESKADVLVELKKTRPVG